MPKIIHNTAGGGGGGTDDQVAAEVPVATSPFTGHLGTADDDVQTALETLDALDIGGTDKLDDATWNGFVDKSDSEITFTDSDRTFEIDTVTGVSDFEVYIEGVKYDTAGDTIQISDVDGLHVIYFDTLSSTVELAEVVNPTDAQMDTIIRTKCLVSIVYWNATTSESVYVGEERHGIIMSTVTHAYLHFIEGLRYVFGLLPDDFTSGDGDDDDDAQFSIGIGAVSDEDLYTGISAVASTTGFPIFYMVGSSAIWTRDDKAGFPCNTYDGTISTRLYYNENATGGWQKTQISQNGRYVLCHVFATTEKDTPLIVIVGQEEYTTRARARDGAQTEIYSLFYSDLPLPEIRPIASMLLETNTSYANAVNARFVPVENNVMYVDWRSEVFTRTVSSVSDHNLLSGLQGGTNNERYHFTSSQHGILAGGLNADALHKHSHDSLDDVSVDDHHAQVHTIVSHDTGATGLELDELTDGSTTTLHAHAGGGGNVIGPGPFVTTETIPVWDGTGGLTLKETSASIDVSGNLTINGNIIVTGNVDNYDVSAMGLKLSNIEDFAEKNTASNTGTGIGVYGGKSLSNLMFKALKDDGAGTMDIALSGDSLSIEFAVSASSIDTAQLAPNSVDNTILDDMPLLTIKGNDTGGTANPKDLTVAEVNAMLGAGGGAPIDAEYITASSDSTLSAEHVLVGGYGIELDDGAGTMTLDAVTEDYYALTSAASVTPNHANGPKYEVVAAHDIEFQLPTDHANWVDGQWVEYRIEQDGTGSRDVTFTSDYRTGEIPSMATAQGAGEITYVLMKYHAGDDKMDVVAFMRGYIT